MTARGGDVHSIAVFIHRLDGGGAQRDAIMLANALAKGGRSVTILTLDAGGALRERVAEEVRIVAIGARRLRGVVPGLRRALLALRPDVLLSSEALPNVMAFLAHRTLPAVMRPRLVLREVQSPSVARREDPYPQSRIAYRFIGAVYARCDRVLTLTRGARDDLIGNFAVPAERVVALSCNAVLDEAALARLAAASSDLSARPPGLLVSVGRLSQEKDHMTLIEAMRLLPEALQARLVIVGDGPRRARLEARVGELGLAGRITFAGYAADPFAWLSKAQLFVSASRYEGFGNAIVEALAAATPVVATDCPFGPREILNDGALGRLVPVGDPSALAAAIEQELRSPVASREQLIARASDFSAEKAADAVLSAIRQPG